MILRVLDLFAGCGGLSLGFQNAGFIIDTAVEIDPIHAETHRINFPNCRIINEDIRKVSNLGKFNIVIGGSPCQGFSMGGLRNVEDPRNSLIYEFARIVEETQPSVFILENVKGISLGKHKELLNGVINKLSSLEYSVVYKILNAADYGVAQNRERVFVVGTKHGLPQFQYPTPTGKKVTVWDAIGDLPEIENYLLLKVLDWVNFKGNKLTGCLRTEHSEEVQKRFAETPHGEREPISRFLKLDPNGLCCTLRAGTDKQRGSHTAPRPIHPYTPRVISVREAARLHSYPDWFQFHPSKFHGFRQVGNSVPPLLAQAVANSVLDVLF
jgi:DNA (cytosine-5)-methyltransferase 1